MVHVMDGWHGSRHGYLTNMCPPKWPDNCDNITSQSELTTSVIISSYLVGTNHLIQGKKLRQQIPAETETRKFGSPPFRC